MTTLRKRNLLMQPRSLHQRPQSGSQINLYVSQSTKSAAVQQRTDMEHLKSFYQDSKQGNRSNVLIPLDSTAKASKIRFKSNLVKNRIRQQQHGAIAALNEVADQSLNLSPSNEVIAVKQQLKNKEIDEAVAKSFQVSNAAQMASLIQTKLLKGVTLHALAEDKASIKLTNGVTKLEKASLSPRRRVNKTTDPLPKQRTIMQSQSIPVI